MPERDRAGSARRLRVLLINDYGTRTGGAELQMLALREGLRQRGHAVRLVTSDASLVPGSASVADRTCDGSTGRLQALSQTLNPSAWLTIRRELAEHPPDVAHLRMFLWQLSPLVLPALAGVPTLFQAAVYKAVCPNGMKLLPDGSICQVSPGRVCLSSGCLAPPTWASTMLQQRLLQRWRRHIDRVAVLSSQMARMFEAAGWGEVAVMGNGVDERPPREPLAEPAAIAYAGRLSREKGVETLLEAFRRLAADRPGLRLLLAGSGPLEPALRAAAAPLGERVVFLGHLSREAMEAAFGAAWVQVVPSLWHEPFGNVSTEAMMRGTAVVASDVGGQSDIVRDGGTGYLVPPGDAGALADRLARIVDDRALAEALGAEGRRVALAEYSREAVLDRLEAAYLETMEAFRRRRGEAAATSEPARHVAGRQG